MIQIRYISMWCIFLCLPLQADWFSYDGNVADHKAKSVLAGRNETVQESQEPNWCLAAERVIDLVALVYASRMIYERYQMVFITPVPVMEQSKIKQAAQWMVGWIVPPDFMKGVNQKTDFFIDSTGIVFQTLLYKTIAKLVVLCSKGDLVDALEQIIKKGKKIFTALML